MVNGKKKNNFLKLIFFLLFQILLGLKHPLSKVYLIFQFHHLYYFHY